MILTYVFLLLQLYHLFVYLSVNSPHVNRDTGVRTHNLLNTWSADKDCLW